MFVSDDELKTVIEWQARAEQEYKEKGAIITDATQPLDKVVDFIVNSL